MKSSLAFVSLLFLPDVFAVAVAIPSTPKLSSKRFGHAVKDDIDSTPVKRGSGSEQEGARAYFDVAAQNVKELKRDEPSRSRMKRSWPGLETIKDLLPRWGSAAQEVKELKLRKVSEHKELSPRRGSPLVVSPTSTSPSTSISGANGYLPPDPKQSLHNSLVGGHPFAGHGPAIVTPASSYVGMDDMNYTFTVPFTGTVPPIANATATLYVPATTPTCPPQPVGEYTDANGNFLPLALQPGYNGSISTNGTIPGNCTALPVPVPISEDDFLLLPEVLVPEDEVLIQGHVQGNTEVVEIDLIVNPNNTTGNSTIYGTGTYYGAGYNPGPTTTPTYGTGVNPLVTSMAEMRTTCSGLGPGGVCPPSATSSTASSTAGPGARQRVPDAANPGFTGPKVRARP